MNESTNIMMRALEQARLEGRVTHAMVHIPQVDIQQADGTIKSYPATEAVYLVTVRRPPHKLEHLGLGPTEFGGPDPQTQMNLEKQTAERHRLEQTLIDRDREIERLKRGIERK